MPTSEVYNMNCMEYMRGLPDNAFDLCIADPPYGDGLHAEGGGKGWFTICSSRERERAGRSTTGSGTPEAGSSGTSATRTRKERSTAGRLLGLRQVANRSGGGLTDRLEQEEPGQKNTAKKLSRGTLPLRKITLLKCSASHAIKSFGAATISPCHRPAAS